MVWRPAAWLRRDDTSNSDVGLPVAELRIDVAHHLEHHASLHLLGLGIERQVVQIVAVYADDAERESNVLHRDLDVLRREHFEIAGTNDCSPSRREWRRPWRRPYHHSRRIFLAAMGKINEGM